mmetsp:Transcript_32682/g.74128  ORF Transcript_32682/g.74128 Transcript_32682/m.74128 type:complete len:368 (+) Transcript_32682:90-1193(+)
MKPGVRAVEVVVQLPHVAHAQPAEVSLDAINVVGQHQGHGPSVHDGAAGRRARPHGLDQPRAVLGVGLRDHDVHAAYAAVQLAPQAVVEEGVAGALRRACKQRPAHHRGSAQRQRHGHVAGRLDASVCDDRHAVLLAGKLRHVVDGAALGPTHGDRLVRGEERAAAHADPEPIAASVQQRLGLAWGHDVTADDVHARELMLHPLQEVELLQRIALQRVQHDGVYAGLHELPHPRDLVRPGRDGGRHEQLVVRVRRSERELPGLLDVAAADDGHELARLVDDRELASLALQQLLVCLRQRDGLLQDLHLRLWSHDFAKLDLPVLDEIDVAARDDALKPVSHDALVGDQHGRHVGDLPEAVDVRHGVAL